jgi:ElaB/YqjD/DUF883 family membrane-anchored ribosome-binding protein
MTYVTDQRGEQEGLAGQASAKVHDAASVAQEKAEELKEQGRSRLSQQLDQRSTDVGSQARTAAAALRRSSDEMRSQGGKGAEYVEQAASQVERVGAYLESRSGDALLRDLEDFARRRPWMLASLGVVGGLALSRFMKASSEDRYVAGGGYRRSGGGGYGYDRHSQLGYATDGVGSVSGGVSAGALGEADEFRRPASSQSLPESDDVEERHGAERD